jgi:DNA-binding GntR family transcriptional regulator
MIDLPPIPPDRRLLGHQVADKLRRAILEGELAPGERLLEKAIAERLSVSRGPIREGLRQLEQEGFVASNPYHDTVVVPLTEEEVRDVLLPIRLILESFSLRVVKVDERDLTEMESALTEMRKSAARKDRYAVADSDIAFHLAWVRLAGLAHSESIWKAIAPRIQAYFTRFPGTTDLREMVREHEALLELIRTGDQGTIRRALEVHIRDRVSPSIRRTHIGDDPPPGGHLARTDCEDLALGS